MTRLIYAGWLLLAVVLLVVALLFVLANDQNVSLSLLVPGASWSAPVGALVLAGFIVGAILGLVAGLGTRQVRRLRTPRN